MEGKSESDKIRDDIARVEQRIESQQQKVETLETKIAECDIKLIKAKGDGKVEIEVVKKHAEQQLKKAEAELERLKAKEKEYRDCLREVALAAENARAEAEKAKALQGAIPHLTSGSDAGSDISVAKPFRKFAQENLQEDEFLCFRASQIKSYTNAVETVKIADKNGGNERETKIEGRLLVGIAKTMLANCAGNTLTLNFTEEVSASDSCSTGDEPPRTFEEVLEGSEHVGWYNIEAEQAWLGRYSGAVRLADEETGVVKKVGVTCSGRADYVFFPKNDGICKATSDDALRERRWILVEKASGKKHWCYGKYQLGLSLLGTVARINRTIPTWGMYLSNGGRVHVLYLTNETIFESDTVYGIDQLDALCQHIFDFYFNLCCTGMSALSEELCGRSRLVSFETPARVEQRPALHTPRVDPASPPSITPLSAAHANKKHRTQDA